MSGYLLVNLDDLISELGEDSVKPILLSFLCPLNKDVEKFLHYKAIEFSKQSLSKTHLVFCSYKDSQVLVGYFTLAHKFISVSKNALSKNLQKKIRKFGKIDTDLRQYVMSSPLIAQLGKNFSYKDAHLITGDELLKMACDKIMSIQNVVGGKIVYLECEDVIELKEFYESNGFVNFGKRYLDLDEKDNLKGDYLIQMLKLLMGFYVIQFTPSKDIRFFLECPDLVKTYTTSKTGKPISGFSLFTNKL